MAIYAVKLHWISSRNNNKKSHLKFSCAGTHIKHRIDEIDIGKCRCKYTLIEGEVLGEKVKYAEYEVEFMHNGEGGSICRILSKYHTLEDLQLRDEDIEEGKEKATELFKAVEAFLLANPHAYA